MEKIQMDFVTDWQEEIIKGMRESGIQFPNNLAKDSLIIKYFTYLRKKGLQQPYNVYKSKEFKCPPKLEVGLDKLIKVLENGGDVSPYLGKKIDELTFKDCMFNDWGILHFHLGKVMEKDSQFIERTGPLLFVYFKENNAYLINIFHHEDWTKKEILQTIQNNWSELVEPFKLKGIIGLARECTEGQHKQLRKAGVTVLIELEDEKHTKFSIMPLGMGITASGDSVNDVRNYQHEIKVIYKFEEIVRNNIRYIVDAIKKGNINVPESLEFKLINGENRWYIKEENTNMIFNLI